MKNIALNFAGKTGMKIFPVNPWNKHPLVKAGTGFSNASSDPSQIESWWSQFRGTPMIGMPTGRINGIIVLDVDRHSEGGVDGIDTLQGLLDAGKELPDTLTVATPSFGLHFYYRYPKGVDIRNSASRIGPGLDIRGNGGFVVAPGSRRFDGRRYEVFSGVPIAEAPQWLVDECVKPVPKQARTVLSKAEIVIDGGCTALAVAYPERYRDAVYFKTRDRVAKARRGNRNNTLFYNAVSLYSFLAGGAFKEERELDSELIYACTVNGLIEDDGRDSVLATMESAKRHGFRNPVKIVREC